MRCIRNLLVFLALGGVGVFVFWWAHDFLMPGARFLLYSGFYAAIALTALRVYKNKEPLDPFAPIIPSFLLLYVYSSASALGAQYTGATVFGCPVDTNVMRVFYVSCLTGLIGLSAGFIAGEGTRPVIRIPSGIARRLSDRRSFTKLLWVAPLLGAVCFHWMESGLDFTAVKSYRESALADRVAKMQMGAGQPLKDVFLHDIPLALLLTLAVLLVFRSRHPVARLAGGAILLAHIATATLGGQRGTLAMAGVLILVFINYRVRKISLAQLAIVFISGFLMTNVISLVRSTNKPMEMVAMVSDSIAKGDTSFLQLQNASEFITGQNLMELISGIRDGRTGYTYGSSVITEFLVFIPRAIYPNRPLPLSERFVDVFYPGVLEAGGGHGFFYLQEGYWALGVPGILVFMVIYACIVQWIYKGFTSGKMTDVMAMWYAYVIYALVFAAVRSGIVGVFKTALMTSLPFLILCWLPNLKLGLAQSPQALQQERS